MTYLSLVHTKRDLNILNWIPKSAQVLLPNLSYFGDTYLLKDKYPFHQNVRFMTFLNFCSYALDLEEILYSFVE
jgi:hypothetical protein